MRFRRIAAVAAAVAIMTGLGTAPAVAQTVAGHASAGSCVSHAGYLVDLNNLGVHLAPHNSVDTVLPFPGSGVTHMGFLCVGVVAQNNDPIWVIGGGGLCLDEGSASQQHLVYSEGCNDSLSTERWIGVSPSLLENNHYGNCLSSGDAIGVTLGGRSCSPATSLNDWLFVSPSNSSPSARGRGVSRTGV
jgi:hypothetical protein